MVAKYWVNLIGNYMYCIIYEIKKDCKFLIQKDHVTTKIEKAKAVYRERISIYLYIYIYIYRYREHKPSSKTYLGRISEDFAQRTWLEKKIYRYCK